MEISKKLKRLLIVVLVALMSLTNLTPLKTVKAENQYLATDKTSYDYDEAINVTVGDYDAIDSSYVWVGLYEKSATDYQTPPSISWYKVSSKNETRDLRHLVKTSDSATNRSVDEAGGEFKVVLFGDGGYTNVIETVEITINAKTSSTEEENYVKTDKTVYRAGEPIMVTAATNVSGAWVSLMKQGDAVDARSYIWYYPVNGETINLFADYASYGGACNGREGVTSLDTLPAGEYRMDLTYEPSAGAAYVQIATTSFVVKSTRYLDTDKDEYSVGEPIMISVTDYNLYGYSWVGLYAKGDTPSGSLPSYYWVDGLSSGVAVNILGGTGNVNRPFTNEAGEYDVVLMYSADGSNYNVEERKTIKLVQPVEDSITVDKAETEEAVGGYYQYKYNEPVLVTATCGNPQASARLCDADPNADHGFENGYYVSYNLADYDEPVDVLKLAIETGVKPEAGAKYRIYLISPTAEDPNNWVKQAKVELLVTYYDDAEHVTWALNEDKQGATVTFVRIDNETPVSFPAELGTPVVVEPKCTETGTATYPTTFTATAENAVVTVNDVTEFAGTVTDELAALGHVHGNWQIDPENPAMEIEVCTRCGETLDSRPYNCAHEESHVHHVEAKEATCEEDGNIEYYYCDICNKRFSDAATEHEIEPTSVVIPALGHDYGEWQYDAENNQHYKECSHDTNKDHVIREDCTYELTITNGKAVHTCSVCGGHYEEVIVSLDKDEYQVNEPVMVTVNLPVLQRLYSSEYFNPHGTPAWIGLYGKDEDYGDPNTGHTKSILWLYLPNDLMPEGAGWQKDKWTVNEDGSITANIKTSDSSNGRLGDFTEGEFEIILFREWTYDAITTVYFSVTGEAAPADEIAIEFNGEAVTEKTLDYTAKTDELSAKIKATVEGDPSTSWVGFYVGGFGTGIEAAEWYWILEENGVEHDFTQALLNAWNKDHKNYRFQIVVFGDSGHEDIRQTINIEIERTAASEVVVKEPTCTEEGMKIVTYEGETEEHYVPIPALGHDYAEEWTFNAEKHQHEKECSRCHDVIAEDCTFEDTTEGNVITHTCTVCGGTYTEELETKAVVERLFGDDRYKTAYAIADLMKSTLGVEKLPYVVLASGAQFPDALAGSYLAAVKGAPILLAPTTSGRTKTLVNYLKSNVESTGTVYILGGTTAVSQDVEDAVKAAGFKVERVSGDDRYKTNVAILQAGGVKDGDEILVCSATDFADALSAASAGKPILLVTGEKLRAAQKKYLEGLKNVKFTLIGGEKAVSAAVADALKAYGTVSRINGSNRYETSKKVAQKVYPTAEKVFVVYGLNYPDGLCAGPLAYLMKAPILLATSTSTKQAKNFVDSTKLVEAIVIGGSDNISDAAVRKIFTLKESDVIVEIKK